MAFAGGAHEERVAGEQPISAFHTPNFLLWGPTAAVLGAAFVEQSWDNEPFWESNPDFYRIRNKGPLHDQPAKWGRTVRNQEPDIAVRRDFERSVRPSGDPLHTDRGAFQLP